MKHLVSIQQWDEHVAHKHVYIDSDEIVAMYTLNYYCDAPRVLEGLWVNEDYRGRGMAHSILIEIARSTLPTALMVRKGNWVDKLYEKYGYSYWYDEDEDYYWMKNYKEEDDNKEI